MSLSLKRWAAAVVAAVGLSALTQPAFAELLGYWDFNTVNGPDDLRQGGGFADDSQPLRVLRLVAAIEAGWDVNDDVVVVVEPRQFGSAFVVLQTNEIGIARLE